MIGALATRVFPYKNPCGLIFTHQLCNNNNYHNPSTTISKIIATIEARSLYATGSFYALYRDCLRWQSSVVIVGGGGVAVAVTHIKISALTSTYAYIYIDYIQNQSHPFITHSCELLLMDWPLNRWVPRSRDAKQAAAGMAP